MCALYNDGKGGVILRVKFENVTVEEVEGSVSKKDASKYYGSFVARYRDPVTKKKESIDVKCNDPLIIAALEVLETEDAVLNVYAELELGTYASLNYLDHELAIAEVA